jgi:hypothetical protein
MKELDDMHKELITVHASIEMQLDNMNGLDIDGDEEYDEMEEAIVATKLFVIKNIILILESKMRNYERRMLNEQNVKLLPKKKK